VARLAAWVFEPSVARRTRRERRRPRDHLTPREREVALLVERNLSNDEIARQLGIQLGTVKIHVHKILKKGGLSRRLRRPSKGAAPRHKSRAGIERIREGRRRLATLVFRSTCREPLISRIPDLFWFCRASNLAPGVNARRPTTFVSSLMSTTICTRSQQNCNRAPSALTQLRGVKYCACGEEMMEEITNELNNICG